MSHSTPSKPRQKNWLLAKSRKWHTWLGLAAAAFLLVIAVSGIVLNYKKPIFGALGLERRPAEAKHEQSAKASKPPAQATALTTAIGFSAFPVQLPQALDAAHKQWGDVPLERVELKQERGHWVYKLKRKSGEELWVDATTGSPFLKGEYERVELSGSGRAATQTDWGKILIDLHTGKIAGEFGKAVISLAALLLLFLSLSGVYMWLKPLLIRRTNAQPKALPLPDKKCPGTPSTVSNPVLARQPLPDAS